MLTLFTTKINTPTYKHTHTHTHTHTYIYIYIYIDIRISWYFLEFINLFISFLHTCIFLACFFRQRIHIAQILVNGVKMRLEVTHVCSLNGFLLIINFCWGQCVSLYLLYSWLVFDIWYIFVVVCVRRLVSYRISLALSINPIIYLVQGKIIPLLFF